MIRTVRLVRQAGWAALVTALVAGVALIAGDGASPAAAQTIYLDFSQGRVAISPDECMTRAQQAFGAEGWDVTTVAAAPERGGYVRAFRYPHGAVLVCDAEPRGGALYHLTVSGVDAGNLPVMEPIARRMGGATSASLGESRNLRATIDSNRSVTLSWRDSPAGSGEWVSIVSAGEPDTTYYGDSWTYTSGQRSGTFVKSLRAGEYEARLYRDSGYTVIDRLRFRVP